MYIYILGNSRCGSTKVYNFILKLCEHQVSKQEGDIKNINYGYNPPANDGAIYNIIKIHKSPYLMEKDIVFFPVRDMRDATVSAMDHIDYTNSISTFVSEQIDIFNKFRSNHFWDKFNIVKYENFDGKHIANILNISVTDAELGDVLDYINGTDILEQPYYKVLIHKNHGTDRAVGKYKTRLSATEIEYIDVAAKEYQIYFGYDKES